MSNTELLIRLRDLHESLSSINVDLKSQHHVDDETIDALGTLATDVANLVDRANEMAEPIGGNEAEDLETKHRTLADQITRFESEHPRVTEFLSQMNELLRLLGV